MSDTKGRRELLLNVGLAAAVFVGMCVAAEAGLRYFLLGKYNPFEPDAVLGVRLKRNYQGAYPRVRVRTDSHGRRIPEQQNVDAGGRWLFLGDSVTFGFSVLAADAFPALVGERLSTGTDVAVAAVPGYNLQQAVAFGRESVALAPPEFIVYGLVVNDLGSALSPATYESLDPHAAAARDGGMLGRSALISFVQRRMRRLTARLGEPETEQTAGNVVRDFASELPVDVQDAFAAQWRDLEALQGELDVPVYVLICPYAHQVYEEPGMRSLQDYVLPLCENSALRCLDPLDEFLAASAEPLFTPGSSYHYNETGHRLLADWLAPRLSGAERP